MSFLKKALRAGLTGGGTGRIADPLKLGEARDKKKPKAPEKTAQQEAIERRQSMLLDEEIEEQEELLKSLASGRSFKESLLAGTPKSRKAAARGASMLGSGTRSGGGSGGGGGGGGSTPSTPSRGTMTR